MRRMISRSLVSGHRGTSRRTKATVVATRGESTVIDATTTRGNAKTTEAATTVIIAESKATHADPPPTSKRPTSKSSSSAPTCTDMVKVRVDIRAIISSKLQAANTNKIKRSRTRMEVSTSTVHISSSTRITLIHRDTGKLSQNSRVSSNSGRRYNL